MIQIKDNDIWFIHSYKEGEQPKPSFSAELLSAYVCPVCHNILKVFFKGNFSYNLSDYKPYGIDYQFGYVPGGTYMEIKKHSCYTITEAVKECEGWEMVRKSRSIANSLEVLSQELGKLATPSQFFISKVMQGKAEYLRVIPDMLGNDDPILMYHRDKIIGISSDENIDSWYDRNQQIGEIFAELITEKGEVEADGDIEIENNIGNMEVLEEQVIPRAKGKGMKIQRGQRTLFSF